MTDGGGGGRTADGMLYCGRVRALTRLSLHARMASGRVVVIVVLVVVIIVVNTSLYLSARELAEVPGVGGKFIVVQRGCPGSA